MANSQITIASEPLASHKDTELPTENEVWKLAFLIFKLSYGALRVWSLPNYIKVNPLFCEVDYGSGSAA
jgi:hypothetical protein